MRERRRKESISGLAALLLLAVFAAGMLSVLLGGAGAYRRLTERNRLVYDSRTSLQYVATKVRQAPSEDAVSLSLFGGGSSLLIREELDGEAFQTRIYCHEGWLMELFTAADAELAPADGERIMQAQALDLRLEGTLLHLQLTDGNGRTTTLALTLRGGEEAQP